MYCLNCGLELDERARFCSQCGCQVQGCSDVEAYQRNELNGNGNLGDDKEEILHKLDMVLPIYQFIAEKDCIIDNLRKEEYVQRTKKARNGGAVFLGIILGVTLTIAMYVFIPNPEIVGSLMSVTLLAPIVFMLIWNNKRKEKAIRKKEETIYEIQQEVMRYVKANNMPELSYLPENYRYYIAAKYIRDCIANQRAHNLSEAINLYEEQMHRWKMENYQYHMYVQSLQKRQAVKVLIF